MPKVNQKQRALIAPLSFNQVQPWEKAPISLRWTESNWVPEMPPDLSPREKAGLDFEYVPDERDATKSRPFAFSVWSSERNQGWYVPWGHLGGGNLDEGNCKAWLENNMTDRDAYGLNMKAEVHMMRNWGMNVDRMKFRPHDVAFSAALLNEHRLKGFSLEALAEEYLPAGERKLHPCEVPPEHFSLAHAGLVAARGISDSMLAMHIHDVTYKGILAEALDRVNLVEDRGILPVVEMERNGALLDLPKLETWIARCEALVEERSEALRLQAGLKKFNPDKDADMIALFHSMGLPKPEAFDEQAKSYKPSWGAEALKKVDSPMVKAALEIRHYRSMLSKYFLKYRSAMDSNNVIRYGLHQMRSVSEFGLDDDDNYGTVTGRFSCGGGKYAINIQQVMKCEKQIEDWGLEFIIRELFIPRPGRVMGASDASQIEFRLFGHYSQAPFVIAEYQRNAKVDFHLLVTMLMNPGVSDAHKLKALRKHMKHNNFGVLYGMGRPKLARRLGLPCTCPVDWYERRWNERLQRETKVRYFGNNNHHELNCKARMANDIMDEYDNKFPEAKEMLDLAGRKAKERGYVHTLLGRRGRFPDGQNFHKALNKVIQGSAADYFKLKMIELYEAREDLGIHMTMPVHDEFVYDIDPDEVAQRRVEELLETQSLQLNVPLIWDSGFGANWKEANGVLSPLSKEKTGESGWKSSGQGGRLENQ